MSYLKTKYNQEFIRKNGLILGEAVIGSHAFNLHNEKSDVDMYGIFYLHRDDFFSLHHRIDAGFKDVVEKENPHDDDITYMEIGKFFELLNSNNPNVLELAVALENSSPYYKLMVDWSRILSKKCEKSFGDYAISQIKKARGLNKKIINPVGETRKTPLDFCKLMGVGKTHDLRTWLEKQGKHQKFCGVVALTNARDSYGLYYDWVSHNLFSYSEYDIENNLNDCNTIIRELKKERREKSLPMGYGFKGIEMENSNEIRLSSIPKLEDAYNGEIEFLGNISYNKDGYIKHCKDYEQYWKWVENRNPERYNNNLKQNYDTKNISHCVRLLSVAKEIGEGKGLILKRTHDRQFLMDIKYGKVEYDDAMAYAENIMKDLPEIYKSSNLPEIPDFEHLNDVLITYRKSLYY